MSRNFWSTAVFFSLLHLGIAAAFAWAAYAGQAPLVWRIVAGCISLVVVGMGVGVVHKLYLLHRGE